jgi:hypothetical protein
VEEVELTVTLQLGKDLRKNGGVKAIEVTPSKPADTKR